MKVTSFLLTLAVGFVFLNCKPSAKSGEKESFTKIDSLTDTYLNLQDSMLQAWNVMIQDENEKIQSMHELLHVVMRSSAGDKDELASIERRLEQLERIRFDQKSMTNPHVVEEYDFESNSLISELVSISESGTFSNDSIAELLDRIKSSDQRVLLYRSDYDNATSEFNEFLDKNKKFLKDIDQSDPQKRPLFQMASEN
jgi:hypothetical protein